MDKLIYINMMIFVIFAIILMAFAVFAIGFLIGYKSENKRISKRKQQIEAAELSDEESKIQKEWKNFLKYDGSAPYGRE